MPAACLMAALSERRALSPVRPLAAELGKRRGLDLHAGQALGQTFCKGALLVCASHTRVRTWLSVRLRAQSREFPLFARTFAVVLTHGACVLTGARGAHRVPWNLCPSLGNLCPALGNLCPSPGNLCHALGNLCPSPGNLCPSFGNLCPSLGNLCPSLGNLCPALGNLCPSPGNLCPSLGNLCPSLGNLCPA